MARVQYAYRRQGDLPAGPKRLVPYWRAEIKERPGKGFEARRRKKAVQGLVKAAGGDVEHVAEAIGVPGPMIYCILVTDA